MDKTYNQTTVEEKWYQFWEDEGLFKPDPKSGKKPYSILMPPPNLTGEPHVGHTLQHLIMDALARFKRMQGLDVLFLPGVDHAGIQFESTLTALLEKEGLSKEKLGREAWLKRAWQFKMQVYKSFHKTWRLIGISADWSREVFTLDPMVEKAVFEQFKTFWEQDLLYKGAYIVQWCPKDQTAIEDIEMEYEERKEKLYFVKYDIAGAGGKESIVVATARPETIYADAGIATYPNHPQYKKFVGKKAVNPLTGSKLPIFEDKRVEKDFGTGALKITPGHDPLDYEIGQDHKLEILHAVDKAGNMTSLAPGLEGLGTEEARGKTVDILNEKSAIAEIKDYTHSVPVCERCKTTIEPLISEEWFVRMKPLADKALKNINKINFVPKKYQSDLSSWMKKIHDWCISRPLWWGYRIPVWYCQKCNPNHEVGKDKQSLRAGALKDMVVSLKEPGKNCQTCGKKNWAQDEKILDTWFSSGLWPLATLGWPDQTDSLKRYFPWDFEITAREIRYLWIARMIMLSLHFTNEIPFKSMFFNGMLRPLTGPKFSKSLGNAVYADELVNQWSVDAVRMTLFTYTAPDRDGRTSREVLNERARNYRNFSTKLKNIGRFIIDLRPKEIAASPTAPRNDVIASEAKQSHPDDKAIIAKLKSLIIEVTKDIESFNMHLASDKLYNFIWHQFADIYIEKTKDRRAEAQPTLEYVFKTSLELLHPFMPFITEELWQKLPHQGESIMFAKWPKAR